MKPIIFDATFILQSLNQKTPSGIGRVEIAWFNFIKELNSPKFFFIQRYGKVMLFDETATDVLSDLMEKQPSKDMGLLSKLLWKMGHKRRAVQIDLKDRTRSLIPASDSATIANAFNRLLPSGGWYISTGFRSAPSPIIDGLQKAGIRTAVMLHDTIPLDYPDLCIDFAIRDIEEAIEYQARYGDLLLCNSNATAADFDRHARRLTGQSPKARPIVAHLGLHEANRTTKDTTTLPAEIDASRPIHVIIGTIEPRKNHIFLIDLWERMARNSEATEMPQLVIIGRWGWKCDEIKTRLEESTEFKKSIFILDGPDDATMASLLHASNSLLMPSVTEGFGLPILEAAREGIPIIANDLAIYAEIAGDYPDLCNVDDLAGWERLIKLRSKQRQRFRPPPIPQWDQHFERVMQCLREADSLVS
ncbi:glycosyltransferase [Brucella gallinifaecis]|uniref:glycosyltransferase n=1 Tax=Brucella gallinifaecis TaxID=215590 RepID=UPI002360902A|nr:glycosyltransferase [Brucella gallinifaecis]